jgi:hypothetical protein
VLAGAAGVRVAAGVTWMGSRAEASAATFASDRRIQFQAAERLLLNPIGDRASQQVTLRCSSGSRPRRASVSGLHPAHSSNGYPRSSDRDALTVAEWPRRALIGPIRRESLDHLAVFDEAQSRRVLRNYVSHHNQVWTHLQPDKNAPDFPRPQRLGPSQPCQFWAGCSRPVS